MIVDVNMIMKTMPSYFENRIAFEDKIKSGRPSVTLRKIIVGEKYGCLTVTNEKPVRVLSNLEKNNEGRKRRTVYYVNVDCSCGNNLWIKAPYLYSVKPNACKKCRAERRKGKYKTLDKEVKYWRTKCGQLKRSAQVRGYEFNLTPEYLKNIFETQKGICALTGQQLDKYSPDISIDRIKNKLGYTVGNVQFAHIKANKIKFNMEMDEFVSFCKMVADFHLADYGRK